VLTKSFGLIGIVFILSLAEPSVAKEKDYENFDLPEQAKVALPEKSFSYKSPRVEVKGVKARTKEPSLSAQEFLFAKESYLTEKRDEAIKLLRQELDSGNKANKDNVLLRLGQLYTEKYMELSFREGELYNQEYTDYEKKKAEGQKVGAPPKADNSRSEYYLKESLAVFYKLEKEYPKHPRIDEIIYFIGFVEMESGNAEKGKKYLERVVKQYSQSKKFDDAAVYLADYNFDKAKFRPAQEYYKLLVSRDSALKDYAKYKLAWCELNTGSAEKAVKDMKSLILSLGGSPDKAKFNLREQALRDLVVFYGETGQIDDAMDFFTKAQGKSKALDNLKVLADFLRSKAQDEAAVKAYSRLIKEFGDAPEAPKWYLGLYDSESRLGKAKGGVAKLVELLDKFNEESDWAKAFPEDKQGEKKETLEMISSEAEKAAYFHHQAGQKSSDKGHYDAAIKLYSSLLKNFPSFPNRKKVAFFQGEALFNQSRWVEASDSYMIAAKMAPKDKLSEEAVYNALLSLDHLTQKSEKITKYSKEEAKTVDTTPKDLSEPEKKFIEITHYYLQEYPKGPRAADVIFREGSIYYQNHHFDDALAIFNKIAKENPQHRTAPTAAHLVLDIYNIRKDYSGLTQVAEGFYKQAGLGDSQFKSEMKQIMGEVDFKQIEPLEKENKWAEAGEAYFKFYQANPTSNLAEKSLYNAFVSFEKAENAARAAESARVFVAKFPKSEFASRMILSLAKTAEKSFDFEQAERFFEEFYEKFPKDPEAKKALYNSAVFSELLEKNKQAIELYEKYLKEPGVSADERRAIQISLAKIHRKEGNWEKVSSIYRSLAKEAKSQDEKIAVLAELTRQYDRAGKNTEKQALVKEIKAQADSKKKSSFGLASYYVAEAEFEALKSEREKFGKLKLRFPPDVFLSQLKKKQKALVKLASSYDGIVEYGVPDWGVAALFEKGEAYQELVSSFRAVKIPKGYKPEEVAELESALKGIDQKDIVPVEKTAKEIWLACAQRASEFKVVNDYAERCRAKSEKGASVTGILPQARHWSYSPQIDKDSKDSRSKEPSIESAEDYLDYLINLSASGKNPEAEGKIKKYLTRYPEEKRAVFLLGVNYLRNKKRELANYFFNQLDKSSGFKWRSLVNNNLGMLALQDKNRIQAISLFEKATQEEPENAAALMNLGSLYEEGADTKDSLKLFEKAFGLSPESEDAVLGYGIALEGEGQYEKAAKVYQAFIADNPNAVSPLFNYSILLGNRLKRREEAAQIMLRYIQKGGKQTARAHEIMKSWR
jgi:tetratricopeptide (TPR) repeat protein